MNPTRSRQREPRWPACIALLGASGLFFVLPESLTYGPDWLIIVLVAAFATPPLLLSHKRPTLIVQFCGHAAVAIVTLAMIVSLGLLVSRLSLHKETPTELLRSASVLWITNILVFAAWYWRLDAGGPHQRDLHASHTDGAFLFPQMTLDPKIREEMGEDDWSPQFVDYLFLAFNTSTAFSPTDVPVLSRWAKGLMMTQAMISLVAIAVLAARAINIL